MVGVFPFFLFIGTNPNPYGDFLFLTSHIFMVDDCLAEAGKSLLNLKKKDAPCWKKGANESSG